MTDNAQPPVLLHKSDSAERGSIEEQRLGRVFLNGEGRVRLERFYRNERDALFTYAVSLTRNASAAEDLVHAAFSTLLGMAKLPAELRPYVFRMIRNGAVDEHRRRSRHQDTLPLLEQGSGPNEASDRLARYREIENAMIRLAENEREAIILKNFSGLSFREIGVLRGVSVNTAASWHRRGLVKLRAILGEQRS